MAHTFQSITLDLAECVATLTLNRPERLNSFTEAIKQAIYAAEKNVLDAQLELERDLQRELGRTADYREGVSAFLQKRAAAFRGE